MATFYTVEGRTPLGLDDRYSLAWFEKCAGQDVDPGLLWKEPGWELFALDLNSRDAIFARTPDGTKIYQAPFLNHALYKSAVALLVMPFSQFIALADKVVRPRNLVHVLNIGRCGSTLAHHIFNKAEGVNCISEPETYFPLALSRFTVDDDEAVALIRASSRFHFLAGSLNGDHTLVVKHHSQSLFQARRIWQADPDAKYIFMFRDAEGWANSLFRMAQGFGMPLIQEPKRKEFSWFMMSAGTPVSYLDDLIDLKDKSVQFESIYAIAWALQMAEQERLQKVGLNMLRVSYEQLNANRLRTIQQLFSYCEIPQDHLEVILTAFESDSQEGTHVGRDRKTVSFTEENIRRFYDVLAMCKDV